MNAPETCDFLVIGTGLAGLATALRLSKQGKVYLLCKCKIPQTNSWLAQGGIAAVTTKTEDSFSSHVEDTLNAGAHLNNKEIVEHVISDGPKQIAALKDWGVQFDRSEDQMLALTKEGGHSYRRILHVGDYTGQAINSSLLEQVKNSPNIEVFEDHLAVDLIMQEKINKPGNNENSCLGAFVLDIPNNIVKSILAKTTILATGGAGKVYLYTSNWAGATGDGIAMAQRAGAKLKHLEFMQFHPTCLYHHKARNFLISEALRGEGGRLMLPDGKYFMPEYHPLKDLAPRDIVARSIDNEMKKNAIECVFLDMTHLSKEKLRSRFPKIYNKCLELGIHLEKDPIPVVPAAHYLCGGVVTDQSGQTNIPRLYCVGETACTGLHGANRLASNSLLECLVFANNASQHILTNIEQLEIPEVELPNWTYHTLEDADELIVVKHMWEEIRHLMWNYVGIVRSNRRLERAKKRLENIQSEISEYYSHFKLNSDIVELRNIALVAELTVESALARKNSIGIHYNIDFPSL